MQHGPRTLSVAMLTRVPGSATTWPLTFTLPARISSSALRRDARPAEAMACGSGAGAGSMRAAKCCTAPHSAELPWLRPPARPPGGTTGSATPPC